MELVSNLDIEPLAYVRTGNGFLTGMHDLVAEVAPRRYRVPIFNPGSNRSQRSELRLINAGSSDSNVTITGLDDRGMPPPGGQVRLRVPAGQSRTITAQQLESGGDDVTGSLGDGDGKWLLTVSSEHPIQVMSILQSADGNLSNISRSPYVEHEAGCDTSSAGLAPADQRAFDCRVVRMRGTVRFTTGSLAGTVVVYNFPSAGNFFSEQAVRIEGRYTYVNTGPNSGTLTLDYRRPSLVVGDRCTARLTFETRISGRVSASCASQHLFGGEGTGSIEFFSG